MKRLENAAVFSVTALGVKPHDAQLDYLLDDHQTKVLDGGRRSGKTTVLAVEMVFKAVLAVHDNRPFTQLVVAPSVDQAKILFDEVCRLFASSPVGGVVEDQVASPFPELRLSRGGKIILRAAHDRGRLLRGHSAHRVVCDESAYLQDVVIEEAVTPLLADVGGQLVLASSPAGKGSLFWRLYERGQSGSDPRVRSFKMRSTDNPHVDRAFIEAQRNELTEAQFAAEYLGEFVDHDGAVFRWDQIHACIDGHDEQERSGTRRFRVGWDPARIRDRSGVVVVDVTEKPWHVVEVLDLRGVDFVEQVRRVAELARRFEKAKVIVDQTNQSVLVDLLRKEGTWVEGVHFTAERKAEMVMGLQLLFERRELVLLPRHRELVEELRFYAAKTSRSGHVRYGAPENSKITDDLVTGLALAVRGAASPNTAQSWAEANLSPFLRGSPLFDCGGFGGPVSGPGGLPDDWEPWGR
jgi:hypothetical protein